MSGWLEHFPWLRAHLLSVMIFLPLLGCVLMALPPFSKVRDPEGDRARVFSLFITLACFLLSLGLLGGFAAQGEFQFREHAPWIRTFGVYYSLGVDGISMVLLLLTNLIMPLVVLASGSVKRRRRGYLMCMLFLQTAMAGTLCALDLFLFYVFWELMLAPMYLIIGIWGGERRIHAALKFVLYTVGGSFLMLIAIFYLAWRYYQQTGEVSFLLQHLMRTHLSPAEELWLFISCALAFGIKVPIFPFHTWLPDAHVEAPTGGSVVLAAILLKMGVYGFLRFAYPLFPRAAEQCAPYVAVLAVIGIIYGAMVAWAQTDIKKLVAYSSVSHLGYCVLALAAFSATALTGAVFQMLSHGFTTGALFLLVGVLYERRHTRDISEYGGVASRMPFFAFLFLAFTLGSIALPLTTGFVGEFMILAGSFEAYQRLTALALFGVILGAVYMLTLYLRTMFGELDPSKNGALPDVSRVESGALLPLLALVLILGVFPQPLIERISPAVTVLLQTASERRSALDAGPGEAAPGERRMPGADSDALTVNAAVNGVDGGTHGL